ncbi:YEATS domain-containing protein 2-like [Salmo trutta]|uniref:YEATS domain-containing protein 2-like n=1 Tax=Salmo trutta TaxID=8032 RepID=UPI001131EBA1|nr:YEATS domain-containing protein 2-like [Salmo trutta]
MRANCLHLSCLFSSAHQSGEVRGVQLPSASERTPSRPKVTEKIALGSYGNSAFQPITASCKIVPQGQAPSPSGSPGKSYEPITMSCEIVSGSLTAKQSGAAHGTRSPAPKVHTDSFLSSGVKVSYRGHTEVTQRSVCVSKWSKSLCYE